MKNVANVTLLLLMLQWRKSAGGQKQVDDECDEATNLCKRDFAAIDHYKAERKKAGFNEKRVNGDPRMPHLAFYSRDMDSSLTDPSKPCRISAYCTQELPTGIWLGPAVLNMPNVPNKNNLSPSDRWSFGGCVAVAWLRFYRYEPGAEGLDDYRSMDTTQLICKCSQIKYKANPSSPAVTPPGIFATTYATCFAAGLQGIEKKKCDCLLPTMALPVIGSQSANPKVNDINQLDGLLLTSDGTPSGKALGKFDSKKLKPAERRAEAETLKQTTSKPQTCAPKKTNVTAIVVPIVVVLVLIIASAGYYWYTTQDDD